MAYRVLTTTQETPPGLDGTLVILQETTSKSRVEIWPALGFNCITWQMQHKGNRLDLIYQDPQLFKNGRPTRSGIPVLFPFPNRVRAGRFDWGGKTYQLPLNDATGKMAIHGFVCRTPWRVVDKGADRDSAWVTGEFVGSKDNPASLTSWPTDYRIRLTYRLQSNKLRQEVAIDCPEGKAMPFGLGFHPYFRAPMSAASQLEKCTVQVPARRYWELADSLPTGEIKPVDGDRDLIEFKSVGPLQLDDVLTGLSFSPIELAGNRACLGTLRDSGSGAELKLYGSKVFREMVLFTPSHREAICLEPYTCTTDAINLQAKGLDAGWLTLPAGQTWTAVVEMVIA